MLELLHRWSSYDNDAEGEENKGCRAAEGGEGGGAEDYWYMGYTECFRANAAYSLYGVLKGEKDKGCVKATYINSFYTTAGVESLTQALESAGYSFSNSNSGNAITSECIAEEQNDDGEPEEDDNVDVHNQKTNPTAVSYGLACSATEFVEKKFYGESCDGRDAIRVSKTLATFNTELHSARCVAIYDSSTYSDDDGYDSAGLELLENSHSCDVGESPHECPDPHGKLALYNRRIARAHANSTHSKKERVKRIISWILLVVGIILLILGVALFIKKYQSGKGGKKEKNTKKKNGRRSSPKTDRPLLWRRLLCRRTDHPDN